MVGTPAVVTFEMIDGVFDAELPEVRNGIGFDPGPQREADEG